MKMYMRLSIFLVLTAPRWAERPTSQTRDAGLSMLQHANKVGKDISRVSLLEKLEGAGHKDVLSTAEAMFAKLGNATEHLSDDQEETLLLVIDIINVTMYGSMQEDHVVDQQTLDDAVADVAQCNTDAESTVNGAVELLENQTNTARTAHVTCRTKQGVLATYTSNNQSTLDGLVQTTWEDCPDHPGQTEAAVKSFVESDPAPYDAVITQFNNIKASFITTYNDRDTSATNEANKKSACDTKQATFESTFCLWRDKYTTACSDLSTCHGEAMTEHSTVVTRMEGTRDARKASYERGEQIVHHIQCILANTDCTDTVAPSVDTARWDLTFATPESIWTCDSSPTDHHPCETVGGTTFEANEYNGLPSNAQATTCNACVGGVTTSTTTVR